MSIFIFVFISNYDGFGPPLIWAAVLLKTTRCQDNTYKTVLLQNQELVSVFITWNQTKCGQNFQTLFIVAYLKQIQFLFKASGAEKTQIPIKPHIPAEVYCEVVTNVCFSRAGCIWRGAEIHSLTLGPLSVTTLSIFLTKKIQYTRTEDRNLNEPAARLTSEMDKYNLNVWFGGFTRLV